MATRITMTPEDMAVLIDAVSYRARVAAHGSCGCGESPRASAGTGSLERARGSRELPAAGPLPDPWLAASGHTGIASCGAVADPIDWYAAFLSGSAIGPALSQAQVADVLPEGVAKATRAAIEKRIEMLVDEWCGTWRPLPVPDLDHLVPQPPRPPRPNEVPLVQMRLGVHFQTAAKAATDAALRRVYENAAGRLFQAGVDRMKTTARVRSAGVRICDDFARMIAGTLREISRKRTLLESESERLRELEGQEPRDDPKIEEVRANIVRLRSELESDRSQLQVLEEEYSAECS